MTATVKVISLLPIFLLEYQEVKLIGDLNRFFHFDHNIFLLDSSVETGRFISRQEAEVIPQSVYVFKRVGDNINGLESLKNIQSKNTFLIVVPATSTFNSNSNLLKLVKKIHVMQSKIKIGMFLPDFVSSKDLKMFLEWFKGQLIVNIFVANYEYLKGLQGLQPERSLNVFTFHPFGKFEVTNVTSVKTYDSYFPSLHPNFQQHQLQVTRQFRRFSNRELWETVLPMMNASFVEVKLTSYDLASIKNNEIDIATSSYPIREFKGNYIYPLRLTDHTILVPAAEPYSDFSAYLRTVTSDELFVFPFITIVGATLTLSVIRYVEQKRILFLESAADVLNLIINDNSYIRYQRLSCVEVFIIVPLTFMGLVITNGILSNMKSYLTQPVLQPQIKTIEEIYRSPFFIYTFGMQSFSNLINAFTNSTKHEDWNEKIFSLHEEEYVDQLEMFNTSKSFLIASQHVTSVLNAQKRLNIRGFYNTQLQLLYGFYSCIVLEKFIYFERVNEIVDRVKSVGLYDLWERRDHSEWEEVILEKHVKRLKNRNEIVVENFEFPMLIVYSWLVGVIVFVMEIIWKNSELWRVKGWRILASKFRIIAEKFSCQKTTYV